jgi:hypothetical protein
MEKRGKLMLSIQALREQRAAKAKAVNEHAAKKDWNPAVDQPVWDALMAEHDSLSAQISNIERSVAISAEYLQTETIAQRADQLAVDNKNPGLAMFAKWLRGGRTTSPPRNGSRSATRCRPPPAARAVSPCRRRSQSSCSMRSRCSAACGRSRPCCKPKWATISLSRRRTALPRSASSSPRTPPQPRSIRVRRHHAVGLQVFVQGRRDPVRIAAGQPDRRRGVRPSASGTTRLGRITNTHFTVGTATAQPNGIITAAGVGVTAANATSQVTAVTYTACSTWFIRSIPPIAGSATASS